MLAFFRKYQKYFFVVITVVIVISFSFFGTYSTLQDTKYVDPVVFTAIDGTEVRRQDIEEMAVFLGTDSEDKLLMGGAWGPNFLNDGVIKKDFIETGLAQILAAPFLGDMKTELQTRLQRERRYTPYEHPQAKFFSAVNVWNRVAPQINVQLNTLRSSMDASEETAFDARVKLFQAQRQFPHNALRYVLRNQRQQYHWLPPDPNFERTDLALFGYHTLSDWFGQKFIRLISEFIINSAIIAENRGYEVSSSEALADLYRNAEISFYQNANNPNLGVATPQEYFTEQLRRMRMDQSQAVSLWQNVMLFRRLFHDLGNSALVDPFTVLEFQEYVNETISGDMFMFPEVLQLRDFDSLQNFEVYLNAVSSRPKNGAELVKLPRNFKKPELVASENPELVQKRYLIEYGTVNKRSLQAKVGVKETWEWEVKDENWEKIKKQFPELGLKGATTPEKRYAALDSLDQKTRAQVDVYARSQIVDQHPEWFSVSLQEAPTQKRVVGIRKKGDNELFVGLKDPEALVALLEDYPNSKESLSQYSPDEENIYKVIVLDRSPNWEILTFQEANALGILSEMSQKMLEEKWMTIRDKQPKEFKKDDGSWLPFEEIKNKVAEEVYKPVLSAIREDYKKAYQSSNKAESLSPNYAAYFRLYPLLRELREKVKGGSEKEVDLLLVKEDALPDEDKLPESKPLKDQFKLVKEVFEVNRGSDKRLMLEDQIDELQPGDWTEVKPTGRGDLAFFKVEKHYSAEDTKSLNETVLQIHQTLSNDVQKGLMEQLVGEMKEKDALSLKYLNPQENGEG